MYATSISPIVSMASTRSGEDGELKECPVISMDTSKRSHDSFVCGVVYNPTHIGDWYCDVPYEQMLW